MRTVHLSELSIPRCARFVGYNQIDDNVDLLMQGQLCASPIRTVGNVVVRNIAKLCALRHIMLADPIAFDLILPNGCIDVTD